MGRIVVGVDGSEGSRQALLWAANEAALRDSPLEVIHAYEPARNVGSAVQAERLLAAARENARELVDGMSVVVEGVQIQAHAVESFDAARTLVDRSRGADLLVVSSRGHGGLRSLLLGSVSHQCAQQAECPVVIVRSGEAQPT